MDTHLKKIPLKRGANVSVAIEIAIAEAIESCNGTGWQVQVSKPICIERETDITPVARLVYYQVTQPTHRRVEILYVKLPSGNTVGGDISDN